MSAGLCRTAWWMSTFPGIAITLVVISVNLVGDGLRDALDPRLRTKGYGEQIFDNMPAGMRYFDDILDAVAHVGLG